MVLNAYTKKKERAQTNNWTLLPKKLEKEEQTKPRVSRRQEIKIRVNIDEIETKNTIEKINKIDLVYKRDKQNRKTLP